MRKARSSITNVLKMTVIPVIIWIIFEMIDRQLTGLGVINTMSDIKTLFRNLLTTYALALAIDLNLSSGRMDLSLGAQMYVGVIFGGNLALLLGWGGAGVLVLATLISAICGGIVGVLFTKLRILPMVLGLGMTLIFECLCYSVNHQQGLVLYGNKPAIDLLSNVWFIIGVAVVALAATTYLLQFSKFGYRLRAVQGSQKLAADSGINIFNNCIGCYVFAGALAGCAGAFEAAYNGSLTPVLNMSSNSTVFRNMFPMVLGIWIGSFCRNKSLGILMGSLSVRLLIIGLSRIGLGSSTQNLIVYSLFLLFVIINTNKNKVAYLKSRKQRIEKAREYKKIHSMG